MSAMAEPSSRTKFEYLVVDTSAFIKNVQLQNFAERCYTVRGVVREIRSNRQLKSLAVLPYDLQVLAPEPEVLAKVVAFAKKTGDYASLSKVDLEVIALTYQLHALHVGDEHLRHEPKAAITVSDSRKPPELQGTELRKGFYMPKTNSGQSVAEVIRELEISDSTDQEEDVVDAEDGRDADVKSGGEASDGEEDESVEAYDEDDEEWVNGQGDDEEDDDDDDDGGWITPSNIAQVKRDYGMNCLEEQPSIVACITTDFAIQNVLKQIGLQIAALDGRVIRQSRTFILRCYACFKTTSDVSKVFCPRCGNDTLKKVAVSLNEDGQQVIHINNRRPLTARYKNRPVGKFVGGKHSANPLMYEDQPLPQQRISRKARSKTNAFAPDYTAEYSPFVMRDIDSRSAVLRTSTDIKQQMKNLEYDNKRRGYMK